MLGLLSSGCNLVLLLFFLLANKQPRVIFFISLSVLIWVSSSKVLSQGYEKIMIWYKIQPTNSLPACGEVETLSSFCWEMLDVVILSVAEKHWDDTCPGFMKHKTVPLFSGGLVDGLPWKLNSCSPQGEFKYPQGSFSFLTSATIGSRLWTVSWCGFYLNSGVPNLIYIWAN